MGLARVGDKLDVAIIREGKPLHVTAVINELPQTTAVKTAKTGSPPAAATPAAPCILRSMASRWPTLPTVA